MAAGAQNLFGVQPSNVGLGAGVRPTAPMAGLSVQTATTKTPQSWFSGPTPQVSTIDSGTTYSANDVTELQKLYDDQEKIRQAQQNKLMELATMGDDRQATAPRPQVVGEKVGQFKSVGHNPLDFGDDYLKKRYFEGLYT